MVTTLAPLPVFRAFDANGLPLAGGKLYTYAAGTTTPLATYTDSTGGTPNANPVILDGNGQAQVWLAASNYKLKLTDSADVLQPGWPVDNIQGDGVALATAEAYTDTLRADLALATDVAKGDALIGSKGTKSNEQASTTHQRNEERYSVFRWFTPAQIADVVAGTKVQDVTVAIQNAIDAVGSTGGELIFPPGRYLISDPDADGVCLSVQYPIRLRGSGAFYTSLEPNASISAITDVLRFFPSTLYATDMTAVEALFIGNPTAGTCAGRHSIYVLTSNTGQYLPKLTIRDCSVGKSSNGYSFKHLNGSPDAQGGMWNALFDNNQFRSGMWFENSGDSIIIRSNNLSGDNFGIFMAQKLGASCLSIEDNNITATGGAIKIDYASRISIRHNNIEIATGAGSNSAVIDFNGASGISYGGKIENNLISAFGTSTVTTGIRVKNVYGVHIEDNSFISGVAGYITAINIVDASAIGTRVGPNSYNKGSGNFLPGVYAGGTTYAAGAYVRSNNANWKSLQAANTGHTPVDSPTWWQFTSEPTIIDGGQGTCGVIKPIALAVTAPQWVNFGSINSIPTYYKDLAGVVHLNGSIKSGLATAGTTIFTLPIYFRPANMSSFPVYSTGGATNGVGALQVYDTTSGAGAVTIMLGGNTLFCLDGVSFPASEPPSQTLADGVSLE